MFYAGFDMLFSILFPILFLVVLGMILYTIIGNISTWNKTTIRRGLPFRQQWYQSAPMFRIPAVPMPEICPVRTDTTLAHLHRTM